MILLSMQIWEPIDVCLPIDELTTRHVLASATSLQRPSRLPDSAARASSFPARLTLRSATRPDIDYHDSRRSTPRQP